jgi:hypothetical protein
MPRLPLSSRAVRASFVLASVLGAIGLAPPARACSYGETDIESSYPPDHGVGVPTNVVLYVSGERVAAESLSLMTEASELVPITVSRVLPTGFDVTPAIELEPNQRYFLRLLLNEDSTEARQSWLGFETGSGPAAPAVLPPPELSRAVLITGESGSCTFVRLCLEPGSPSTTLFAAHPGIQLSERWVSGTLNARYDNADVPEDCLLVWRRDALGNRSEAVELCGADVPRFDLGSSDEHPTCEEFRQGLLTGAYPANPQGDDPEATADAAGCNLVRAHVGCSAIAHCSVVLALLSALGVRRRRPAAFSVR